jgi:hypothetical protein
VVTTAGRSRYSTATSSAASFAGEAHSALRERRPAGIDELHAAAAFGRQRRRQRLQVEVIAGENRQDAFAS